MNPADEKLITAWQQASSDLGIEIETPYIVNTEGGKVSYPVFVKNFGKKKGTIIARHDLFMDYPMPKHKDFFFSAVNAESYAKYNREHFIDTLEDWGYFGTDLNKPNWYEGKYYKVDQEDK